MPSPTANTAQTPLTCIMPIKSAADAAALAQILPKAKPAVDKALDSIGTVHFARFVFLQNNTQLAIITTFDGTFSQYITDFANGIGDIFNTLFQHVSDPPPLPVQQHVKEFIAWVEAHDAPHVGFYSAYPLLEVQDIRPMAAAAGSGD